MADLYSGAGGGAGAMAMVRGDMGAPQGEGPGGDARVLDVSRYGTHDVFIRLIRYVRPHAGLALLAFAASIVGVVLALYVPILVGQGIDCVLGAGRVAFAALMPLLARMAAVVAVSAAAQWVAGYCTNRLSYETVRDLRLDAIAKLRGLPFSFLDAQHHGDLISRVVNDADQVGEGLLQGITQLFSGVVTIAGTLGFMFFLSVPMGVVVVVLTPLSMLVASIIARLSAKSFADSQRLQGQVGGYVEEMVSNQALVTAFARGDSCREEFGDINRRLRAAGEHAQFVSSLSNPTTRLVNNITYAVVAVAGFCCVISGWPSVLSVGQVQSFLSYANQYMRPFNEISGVVTQLQAAFASARRLFALLDIEAASDTVAGSLGTPETEGGRRAPASLGGDVALAHALTVPVAGDIEFSHVDFSYVEGSPVLRDVSFHARPGQRFALVGPTGCGKTTLISLLMRFYDVDGGTIYVDGRDTSALSREVLRSAFGMVLQETWLMSATIRENIAYGRPGATEEQVRAAAVRAHAHEFIRQLPDGYDTLIGEDGGLLSQGQRQLICIARVMLADPAILLLDEATSSIDTRTELQVQEAFDLMMQGRTSLVVAHRLSTVRASDCILVMEEGRIVERGTHDELLAAGGTYADLYRSQFANAG